MTAGALSSLALRAQERRGQARRGLYQAFQEYRLSEYGSPEGACAHCLTRGEFDDIAATRLEELTEEQAGSYSSAVWPGTSDFKYFLPRLLELAQPMDAPVGWDVLERKLPPERWLACSELERQAIAAYVAAADECARTVAASTATDIAELLRPMIVPSQVADGLPLARAIWDDLRELRSQLLGEQIQRFRASTSASTGVVLARAVNALIDGRSGRALKARLAAVVPSDDVLLCWLRSEEAEQVMTTGLERGVDDEAGLCLATALANLASLTAR